MWKTWELVSGEGPLRTTISNRESSPDSGILHWDRGLPSCIAGLLQSGSQLSLSSPFPCTGCCRVTSSNRGAFSGPNRRPVHTPLCPWHFLCQLAASSRASSNPSLAAIGHLVLGVALKLASFSEWQAHISPACTHAHTVLSQMP